MTLMTVRVEQVGANDSGVMDLYIKYGEGPDEKIMTVQVNEDVADPDVRALSVVLKFAEVCFAQIEGMDLDDLSGDTLH